MRTLPGRFADQLSARALDRTTAAAAAGRWEEAAEELIAALDARAEVVTAGRCPGVCPPARNGRRVI
jgi:hypothetical protein